MLPQEGPRVQLTELTSHIFRVLSSEAETRRLESEDQATSDIPWGEKTEVHHLEGQNTTNLQTPNPPPVLSNRTHSTVPSPSPQPALRTGDTALQGQAHLQASPGLGSICLNKQEVAALGRGSVVSGSSHPKGLGFSSGQGQAPGLWGFSLSYAHGPFLAS